MPVIAVIDDDVYIGDMIEKVLSKEGYTVLRAYSGTEALLLLKSSRPDLILLDLMLPGLSGEELLPRLLDIPVIVISAKADIPGKVALLQNGAADYLTKPFDVRELSARIAVQLRNRTPAAGGILSYSHIRLDSTSREVWIDPSAGNDTPIYIRLTKTEYAILKLLMLNPRQIVTKSLLLDRISADTPDCMESSLKVHISNLRKKLRDASGIDYIEAVWGIGFKLRDITEHV